MFLEQFQRVKASGLLDQAEYLHIGINAETAKPVLLNFLEGSSVKRADQIFNSHIESEADTLADLWKFSQSHKDWQVLYFHSKGITHLAKVGGNWLPKDNAVNTQNWREYLEYFNIDQWRICSSHLSHNFDIAGTEWVPPTACVQIGYGTYPHYSGNFWWANCKYVCRLNPLYLYEQRMNTEKWIATGNPNYFNFWFSNRDLYYHLLRKEEYIIK